MATDVTSLHQDQRKYARLDIALSVSYSLRNAGGTVSEIADAMASDISAGGLRLMTADPLRAGDIIDLEITITGQDGAPIQASGEVVWQNQITERSFEIGAVIKYMDDANKRRFMAFVFDQMSRVVGGVISTVH